MGTALASFVVSGFVLLRMQLRKIMPVCALLQRMGIFRVERKNLLRTAGALGQRVLGSVTLCGGFLTLIGGFVRVGGGLLTVLGGLVTVDGWI